MYIVLSFLKILSKFKNNLWFYLSSFFIQANTLIKNVFNIITFQVFLWCLSNKNIINNFLIYKKILKKIFKFYYIFIKKKAFFRLQVYPANRSTVYSRPDELRTRVPKSTLSHPVACPILQEPVERNWSTGRSPDEGAKIHPLSSSSVSNPPGTGRPKLIDRSISDRGCQNPPSLIQ